MTEPDGTPPASPPPSLTAEHVRRLVEMVALPSTASVAMLLGRFAYVGDTRFRFCGLLLNLLLAWVPMALALVIGRTTSARRFTLAGLFAAWLLFFPNAFYITTDLIHTHKFGTDGVDRWYDILMTACFALSGLFLGSVSLLLLHTNIRNRWGPGIGWSFAGTVLALGAFGIYLGRFLRLNSWDVFARPRLLIARLADLPGDATAIATFCGAFFLFSLLVYSFVFSTTRLNEPAPQRLPASPRRLG